MANLTIEGIPRWLNNRLQGLGTYVTAVLQESDLRKRLSTESLQTIQLVVFVRTLDDFLIEGSRAAERAVDALAELGVAGFEVGGQTFQGRNEAVTRGSRLSAALRESIHAPGLWVVAATDMPLHRLIVALAERLAR